MTLSTMPDSPPKSLQQWLAQGDALYTGLLKECEAIEGQIAELEHRLAAKQAEANHVGQVIGKPALEGNRRLSAQLVTTYAPDLPPPRSTPHVGRPLARPAREPITREVVPPRG
ncbi:MAG TPA: hypothetical protein VN541_04440 [Tepidisphaeraceae bacterium]|nr:hypothetical protein [Tepidisphaeraceae bacterium]